MELLKIVRNLNTVILSEAKNPVFMLFLNSSLPLHFVQCLFRMTFIRYFYMLRFLLFFLLTAYLLSCSSTPFVIEVDKMYRFYTTSSPLLNTVDLGAKEYKFLEAAIDTMKEDPNLKINIVSYREEGYYDELTNENCIATKIARDYLLQKNIELNRITHFYGKADMDKNISHQGMAYGKSSANCWLEMYLYY